MYCAGIVAAAIETTMLVQIGKRPDTRDVVELLLECHERIRKFLAMARALTGAAAVPHDEIRGVASQVRRYFAESLPMHIADEDEEIAPRLIKDAAVAAALALMSNEHATHEPLVAELIAVCDVLIADPRQVAAVSIRLTAIVDQLDRDFAPHLAREEQVIFPALARLPERARDEILAAMRRRRARALG
jgi:iron-sulfur cluster repair protein YtfE (RIC family)